MGAIYREPYKWAPFIGVTRPWKFHLQGHPIKTPICRGRWEGDPPLQIDFQERFGSPPTLKMLDKTFKIPSSTWQAIVCSGEELLENQKKNWWVRHARGWSLWDWVLHYYTIFDRGGQNRLTEADITTASDVRHRLICINRGSLSNVTASINTY